MEEERFVVSVDPRLKRRFKAAVAQNGTTMTAVTEAFMELYNAGELDNLLEAEKEPQLETAAA